jgi:hypothetical protein
MKQLKYRLATCVYCHCNICNNSIYFCNIQMKHLKYKSKTPEKLENICNIQIYFCNVQIKHLETKSPKRLKHLKHSIAGGHGLPGGELR